MSLLHYYLSDVIVMYLEGWGLELMQLTHQNYFFHYYDQHFQGLEKYPRKDQWWLKHTYGRKNLINKV